MKCFFVCVRLVKMCQNLGQFIKLPQLFFLRDFPHNPKFALQTGVAFTLFLASLDAVTFTWLQRYSRIFVLFIRSSTLAVSGPRGTPSRKNALLSGQRMFADIHPYGMHCALNEGYLWPISRLQQYQYEKYVIN